MHAYQTRAQTHTYVHTYTHAYHVFSHIMHVYVCIYTLYTHTHTRTYTGAEDWNHIEGDYGYIKMFMGGMCVHFTTDNNTPHTRVSIDFRVIPENLCVHLCVCLYGCDRFSSYSWKLVLAGCMIDGYTCLCAHIYTHIHTHSLSHRQHSLIKGGWSDNDSSSLRSGYYSICTYIHSHTHKTQLDRRRLVW